MHLSGLRVTTEQTFSEPTKKKQYECKCGKVFKGRSGLFTHKKKCPMATGESKSNAVNEKFESEQTKKLDLLFDPIVEKDAEFKERILMPDDRFKELEAMFESMKNMIKISSSEAFIVCCKAIFTNREHFEEYVKFKRRYFEHNQNVRIMKYLCDASALILAPEVTKCRAAFCWNISQEVLALGHISAHGKQR